MKVLAGDGGTGFLDFAHLSADRLGGDVEKWLDDAAMAEDTAKTERHQTERHAGWGGDSGPGASC